MDTRIMIWHIHITNRGLHYFVLADNQKEAMEEVFLFHPHLLNESVIMDAVGVVEVYDTSESAIVGYTER